MAEYIDRGKLVEFLKRVRRDLPHDSKDFFTRDEMILNFQQFVESKSFVPAADVQPVKHGQWITSEITTDSGYTSCSCCHSEYYIGDLQNLEGDNDFVMYCPNCGAKMDGGE